MDATFTAESINEESLSTALPLLTKSTSAENQYAILSTSVLIFTDHQRDYESSIASRITNDQSQAQRSSEIPVHMQAIKISSSASYSDDPSLTTDNLQPDSIVETSLRQSRTSSAQNVGIVSESMQKTTAETESRDSFLLVNTRNFTTAMPLRDENIVHSKQPLEVSQMHISEDAQKSLLLRNNVAAGDTGHVSTSYAPTTSLQFSRASQLSVSATVKKSSAVAAQMQTEVAHSQFFSSRSHFTTSKFSELSSTGYTDEYTGAAYRNGEYC